MTDHTTTTTPDGRSFERPVGPGRVKYLLCPGQVQSKTDRQYHYIGARELARLYGVSMCECKVIPERMFSRLGWRPPEGAIELHPRWDGNYVQPNIEAQRAAVGGKWVVTLDRFGPDGSDYLFEPAELEVVSEDEGAAA